MWRNWNSLNWWWEYKISQSLYHTVWQFLQKLNLHLQYDAALAPRNPQKRNKTCPHTDFVVMFIAALLKTAPHGRQLTGLSTSEWRNQLWYTHTTRYHSAVYLKSLHRVKKARHKRVQTVWFHFHKTQTGHSDKSDKSDPSPEKERGCLERRVAKGNRVMGSDGNVLYLDCGGGFTHICDSKVIKLYTSLFITV